MAATQSPAAPSSAPSPSSSSFASRRPLARAALPPFTLPPPPEFPRPTAAASASSSTLSPPTPTPSAGGAAQQPPTGSPYSTNSSPGFAAARSSSSSSTTALSSSMLAHPQRASSHSPYEPHPRSGLSHPLNGGNLIQLSPRKPLPGGSSGQSSRSPPSRFTEKLPSIASLIPPPSQYGLPPRSPSQNGPAPGPGSGPGLPAPGYLAMPPVKGPWGLGPPPASNPRYYHEFTVPEYPIARETSQQDRPFRCDLCTQCFSRNHDLKRHKRIHMAAKPFPCPTCNKSFSRRDALKRHRLVKACYKKNDSQAAGEGEPSRTSSSPDGEPEYTTAHWKPPEVALLEKLNKEKHEEGAEKDSNDVNDNAETETPKTPPRETGGEVEESQP